MKIPIADRKSVELRNQTATQDADFNPIFAETSIRTVVADLQPRTAEFSNSDSKITHRIFCDRHTDIVSLVPRGNVIAVHGSDIFDVRSVKNYRTHMELDLTERID